MSFPHPDQALPSLTANEMAEVDRIMTEELGVDLLQMMENAGRHLAHLVRVRFMEGDVGGSTVTVLAGSGGNGGGAVAAARRLHLWGGQVRIICLDPPRDLEGATARQFQIVRELGIEVIDGEPPEEAAEVVIDGLIGYSLQGDPRGRAADLIRWANAQPIPVVALDLPSGFDASSGTAREPVVSAAATLTLALPKAGMLEPRHRGVVGEVYLGDIGVPGEIYERTSAGAVPASIFSRSDILRIS